MKITEEKRCTACYACVNVCPKQCISMVKSGTGAIYPVIDDAVCVECGICKNTCPSNQLVKKEKPNKVYAAVSRDEKIYNESTSGGVSAVLAKYVIEQGGVVYGAAIEGNYAKIVRISDENDLNKIQGSKYVHCHMNKMMREIKSDLQMGLTVMVTGTPCQIAGVRKFLGKNYGNLLLIDILCHGTPSQDCLRNGLELETNEVIRNLSFRKGKDYCLSMEVDNGQRIEIPYRSSFWFNGFVEGYLFRENCYNCLYAGEGRVGDITLGDFWGLGRQAPTKITYGNGINVVLINTELGSEIWGEVSTQLVYEERTLHEAKKFNHPLKHSADMPKQYLHFKKIYKKQGGKNAILFAYKKKTIFIWIRRVIRKNHNIYKMVTSIPGFGNKFLDYPKN